MQSIKLMKHIINVIAYIVTVFKTETFIGTKE